MLDSSVCHERAVNHPLGPEHPVVAVPCAKKIVGVVKQRFVFYRFFIKILIELVGVFLQDFELLSGDLESGHP